MKKCFIALSGVMAIVFLATAQTQTPNPRAAAIKARHDRGEKISLEDEDYYQSTVEHNNQVRSAATQKDWAAAHPTRESTGMIPLSELGKDKYKGEEGGLYPGGRNTAPAHEMAGMKLAQSIRHLDAQGQPSQDGKIVLITIGMSNTYQESRRWRIRAGVRQRGRFAARDRQRSHGSADSAPDCQTGREVLDDPARAAEGNGLDSGASAGGVVEGSQSTTHCCISRGGQEDAGGSVGDRAYPA